MNINELKVFFL